MTSKEKEIIREEVNENAYYFNLLFAMDDEANIREARVFNDKFMLLHDLSAKLGYAFDYTRDDDCFIQTITFENGRHSYDYKDMIRK